MTKENRTVSLKDRLIQSVQIVIFGLLSLALTVFLILEMIPSQKKGLQVKEELHVASFAIDATGVRFVSSLNGIVKNTSDAPLEVASVRVTVSNGKIRREVELEGFVLPPRCEQDLTLDFECDVAVNTVVRVEADVNGSTVTLENRNADVIVSGALIFYAVLLIPSVLLLVRASKVRYYLYQESKLAI